MSDVTLTGRTLGEFQLLDRLDEGAFGAVYLARQQAIERPVVVKVLHQRFSAAGATATRFVREARLASRVDHPCVAHVYAAGCEADGLLWIAMELVHGISLAERLKRRGPMPLDEFVPFFSRICAVVQAAHANGVVHRDLKPANIMVREIDGDLVPKLIDFGVAKLMTERAPDDFAVGTMPGAADRTTASTVIGTWPYVAPELWLSSLGAAVTSDIYALGVLAYEALTGRAPFRGASIDEYQIEHLSAKIPRVGQGLPTGLDDVFSRALAKVPEDRYLSATELAAAFAEVADKQITARIRAAAGQWHAAGRPLALLWRDELLGELEGWSQRTSRADARLTSTDTAFIEASRRQGEVAEERARRGRARAKRLGRLAAAFAATAVFGVAVGVSRYETRIAQQQAADAHALARATAVTAELEQARAALLHDDMAEAQQHLGRAWGLGEQSDATAFMYARALQPLRAELARIEGHGRMWSASWSADGLRILTADDRGAQVWDGSTYAQLVTMPHRDVVYGAVWKGTEVVTACGDGAVRIWDPRGRLVRELRLAGQAPRWYALAVAGERIAAVDAKGAVAAVWDTRTGAVLTGLALGGAGWPSVAFSADGRWLAASGGSEVQVVHMDPRFPTLTLDEQVRAIAWSGARLLTGSANGDASIWNVPDGQRLSLHRLGETVTAAAFTQDGHRAAIGGDDGTERVFDVDSGRIVSQGNHLRTKVAAVAFSADGAQVAAAGASGELAVSDVSTGLPIEVLEGPQQALRGAAFSSDGHRVLAASVDGTARVWSAAAPYRQWSAGAVGAGYGLFGGAEADGRYLAIAIPGALTRVWDTTADRLLAELPEVPAPDGDMPVPFPVVSDAGDRAAIARGAVAEVYALPSGQPIETVRHAAVVTALAFFGGRLVSGDANGAVMVGDAVALQGDGRISALAVMPDGRIVAADVGGRVRVIGGGTFGIGLTARILRSSQDGQRLLAVPHHIGPATAPALLDLEHGAVTRLEGPQAIAARWTPTGILTAHMDGSARLWDTNGKLRQTYRGGARFLSDADMSPDGSIVIGGGGDGLLRFWDAATGRPLWVVAAHKPYVMGVHFLGSGLDLVTRGTGGEIARWHLPDARSVISMP